MEIEAKFRVENRSIFVGLRRLAALGPFELLHLPGVEHQHNTYFDTADRRLSGGRVSLRVRDLGSRRIATVKRSLGSEAGIHTREEWEVEIDAGEHPADWPDSAARDLALAALAGAPIALLMIIRTRRQYTYAERAGLRVAELSLDEGAILAGGHALGFRELEVELLADGTRADLDALIEQLQARFPLIPEPRGKKSRGMDLLDRAVDGMLALPARRSTFLDSAWDDALAVGA